MEYGDRVRAGAAYLDKVMPGWCGKINLDTLDISNDCTCVLGQLFEHYMFAVQELSLSNKQAAGMGFFSLCLLENEGCASRDEKAVDEFAELTSVWREFILSRRTFSQQPERVAA